MTTIQPLPTPVLHSPEYRYLIATFSGDTIIGDLPLKGVSYSNLLSSPGEFSGKIKINKSTRLFEIREKVVPGKTSLFVIRNNVPIWGGIIWKAAYSGFSRELSIEAKTFESYLFRRFQTANHKFDNVDQFQIARTLVSGAIATIGTTASTSNSGVKRVRNMYRYEFKSVGEELEQLSDLINGFDWNITLTLAPGNKVNKSLEFFYPYRGVSKANTRLSFEYPGSIRDFTYTWDSEEGATRMYAIGAGESEEQIDAVATNTDGGWPILESSYSYKTVTQRPTLQAHADSDLKRLQAPVEIIQASVRANVEPFLGEYNPGDWARFSFSDDYFSPQESKFMRIIGYEVTLDDSGVESVGLTLDTEEIKLDDKV